MKPEYRFKYQIVDEANDSVIVSGGTFISENISQYGDNESVDMEVGKALRIFKKEKAYKEEKEKCSTCNGKGKIEDLDYECNDSTGYNTITTGKGTFSPCPDCQ